MPRDKKQNQKSAEKKSKSAAKVVVPKDRTPIVIMRSAFPFDCVRNKTQEDALSTLKTMAADGILNQGDVVHIVDDSDGELHPQLRKIHCSYMWMGEE